MKSPPTYVGMVQSAAIRLYHVNDASRERMAAAGLVIGYQDFYECISFENLDGPVTENASFVEAFRHLNRVGILFAQDHKQTWAPSDLMRELQRTGQIHESFAAIAWRGRDQWFTTVYEPPGGVERPEASALSPPN